MFRYSRACEKQVLPSSTPMKPQARKAVAVVQGPGVVEGVGHVVEAGDILYPLI